MKERSKAYFEQAEQGRKALTGIELPEAIQADIDAKYSEWLLALNQAEACAYVDDQARYEHFYHNVYLPFE